MAPGSAVVMRNIQKLPPQVQDAIAGLPEDELHVFGYIASWHDNSLDKKNWRDKKKSSRGSGNQKSMPEHSASLACACLVCYMHFFGVYEKSSHKLAIDHALALNDRLVAESGSGLRRGKAKKGGGSRAVEIGKEEEDLGGQDRAAHSRRRSSRNPGLDPSSLDDKEPTVSKPKSKQVAPVDQALPPERGCADESRLEEALAAGAAAATASAAGTAAGTTVRVAKAQSLGSRVSEAVCFACRKLVGMWYPRIRPQQQR